MPVAEAEREREMVKIMGSNKSHSNGKEAKALFSMFIVVNSNRIGHDNDLCVWYNRKKR